VGIAPFVRQQELWPGAGVHSAQNLTYTYVGRGPAAAGVGVGWGGGGAPGQDQTSGPARGHGLGKFFVGGVPLCCVLWYQ
jgi:hypothetical protein